MRQSGDSSRHVIPPDYNPTFRCCNASMGAFSHELTANPNSVTSQPPHEHTWNNEKVHAIRPTHNGPQNAAPVVQPRTSGMDYCYRRKMQNTHAPRGTPHSILCVVCGMSCALVNGPARYPLLALPTNMEGPPAERPQILTHQCKITPPTHQLSPAPRPKSPLARCLAANNAHQHSFIKPFTKS